MKTPLVSRVPLSEKPDFVNHNDKTLSILENDDDDISVICETPPVSGVTGDNDNEEVKVVDVQNFNLKPHEVFQFDNRRPYLDFRVSLPSF